MPRAKLIRITNEELFKELHTFFQAHGWTQGQMHNGDCHCIMGGALMLDQTHRMNGSSSRLPSYRLAELFDKRKPKTVFHGITGWNDTRGRTKEQVLTALESHFTNIQE